MNARIVTPRLILEPLAESDLRWAMEHSLPDQPRDWPDEAAVSSWKLSIEGGSCGAVWLVRTRDGEIVGDVGFKGPMDEEGALESLYFVRPAHRRRGFASEALAAVIDHAFRFGARLVRAEVRADNDASIRVLARCGFARSETNGDQVWFEKRLPGTVS